MTITGGFSLSDAKNDEGEWIMSPEQIRAEMSASSEPEYYDCCGFYGRCRCDDIDGGE